MSKVFDKTIQGEKMKYWRESQAELERLTGEDNREFWKRIGRTGVGEEHKKIIPMVIYNDKWQIVRDEQQVLTKWQNDLPVGFLLLRYSV